MSVLSTLPDWDRATDLRETRKSAPIAALLKPSLVHTPSPCALDVLGSIYAVDVIDGRWAGIAYLLESVRFGGCNSDTRNHLASQLMGIAADTDWANVHLERQVHDAPGDLDALRLIGALRDQQGRYADAITVLQGVLAREADPTGRRDTLQLLVATCRETGDSVLAGRYAAQLAREFPDAGQ